MLHHPLDQLRCRVHAWTSFANHKDHLSHRTIALAICLVTSPPLNTRLLQEVTTFRCATQRTWPASPYISHHRLLPHGRICLSSSTLTCEQLLEQGICLQRGPACEVTG